MRNGREHSGAIARVIISRLGSSVIESGRQDAGILQDLYREEKKKQTRTKAFLVSQRSLDKHWQDADKIFRIKIQTLFERMPSI